MGTKYSTQTATGYNASPPSDDGTAVASNEIKWDIVKPKLADPVKDLADNINTALLTHIDESVLDKGVAYTTTAADHKRTINVTAAATQSLGDAATMAVGYIVTIKNSHTAAITVDLATGADTLDGTAAGSLSLEAGEAATFGVESTADGYLIKNQKLNVAAKNTAFMETVWPVGSIYQSTVSTNPNTLFGVGTWTALEDRFLIGASATYTAASTGGSADAIVVAHTHTIPSQQGVSGGAGFGTATTGTGQSTGSAGSSGTNANLPPYLSVYMWERTA